MFKKAARKGKHIKLAITGPSGSGKTYSALRLAPGLAPQGKIALVDTENGCASLYSSDFDFDVSDVSPPFTVDKLVKPVNYALENGYDVLIVDSSSHFWNEVLEMKHQLDKRGGNSFANWKDANKYYDSMLKAILFSDIHVIDCMRSKMDYVLEENEKGKAVPRKIGLVPVMRDGVEYEFTTVFDLDMNHNAMVSKDRTGLFVDEIFQITEKTGRSIAEWLKGAVDQSQAHERQVSRLMCGLV